MVPTACFGLLSPFRPISSQSSFGWWCPDSLVEKLVHDFNSMRVVRVWIKSVIEIRRKKFAQGTKSARLFSSSQTSRSAVLSHGSDSLLRTAEGSCFSSSSENMHWFLGVLCRMPSKDEQKSLRVSERWLTVHEPIQPMHLHKQPFAAHTHVVLVRQLPLHFPSTSFKSRWPRFLGNVWIKMVSFDILIARYSHRSCMPKTLQWSKANLFGGNTWLSECVRGLHFPMLCPKARAWELYECE